MSETNKVKPKIGQEVHFACLGHIMSATIRSITRCKYTQEYFEIYCDDYKIIETIDVNYPDSVVVERLGTDVVLKSYSYKVTFEDYSNYTWWFPNALKFEEHVKKCMLTKRKNLKKTKRRDSENNKINIALKIIKKIYKQGYVYFKDSDGNLSEQIECDICYFNNNYHVYVIDRYNNPVSLKYLNKVFFLSKEDYKKQNTQ